MNEIQDKGLDVQEEYFPMVSRTDAQTFFGLPPKSLRPKAPDTVIPTRSVSWENNRTPRFSAATANYHRTFAADDKNKDDFVEVDYGTHSDIYEASPAPRVRGRTRSETSGSRFHTPTPTPTKGPSDLPPATRALRVRFN
jgi:hypothetical protein